MAAIQTIVETLVVEHCCSCHVAFGMTAAMQTARRRDHDWFWCPNGHRQYYSGRSDVEQARADAQRLRDRLEMAERSEVFYREQAAFERRRAAAQRGQRTRVMNLITRGVCPVAGCRRNFDNVREHMATQHPGFHTHEDGDS